MLTGCNDVNKMLMYQWHVKYHIIIFIHNNSMCCSHINILPISSRTRQHNPTIHCDDNLNKLQKWSCVTKKTQFENFRTQIKKNWIVLEFIVYFFSNMKALVDHSKVLFKFIRTVSCTSQGHICKTKEK